jgi:putative DNA primase/helicase
MNSTTNNPAPQLPGDPHIDALLSAVAKLTAKVQTTAPATATKEGKSAAPSSSVEDKEFVDPFSSFPAAPKKERRWCVWRYERKGEKLTKVPYQSVVARASSTNPETWLSFEQACTLDKQFHSDVKPTPEGCVAGIGFYTNGEDTFIDFDDCRNPTTGKLEPWAEATVRDIGSYAEISPSGTGVHAFALGTVDKASKINGCELYSKARYFTVTGN